MSLLLFSGWTGVFLKLKYILQFSEDKISFEFGNLGWIGLFLRYRAEDPKLQVHGNMYYIALMQTLVATIILPSKSPI